MEIVSATIGRLPLGDAQRVAIRHIKSKIVAMLEERSTIDRPRSSVTLASSLWSDVCSYFDYMLGLPEDFFARLRIHTYHLTSDNYQTYYFRQGAHEILDAWRSLIETMPREYVLSEPEGGMGFVLSDGTIVSRDLLRFQGVVNTLYEQNVLPAELQPVGTRTMVLEIGAGYGGLAHHLARLIRNSSYVIVDLPETLLFSAVYLTLLNPAKRIYTYLPGEGASIAQVAGEYDFILIPNYRLSDLQELRFDLAINVASLQEMRTEQVEMYLDFVAQTCKGVFYSLNQDAQWMNRELANLSDMLAGQFAVTEIPYTPPIVRARWKHHLRRVLRGVSRAAGISARGGPYKQYICRPRPVDRAAR